VANPIAPNATKPSVISATPNATNDTHWRRIFSLTRASAPSMHESEVERWRAERIEGWVRWDCFDRVIEYVGW
jgi:hypothetical protein